MSKKKTRRVTKGAGSMGGTEHTKGWKKRYAQRRREEEKSWAALSGPVTVQYLRICQLCGEKWKAVTMADQSEELCSDCRD